MIFETKYMLYPIIFCESSRYSIGVGTVFYGFPRCRWMLPRWKGELVLLSGGVAKVRK